MTTGKKKIPEPDAALIYCRVSTKKQTVEGSGLESQEHRCRQHANAIGCNVEAVFPDDVSGGGDFLKRPGMVALLAYLDANPTKKYVVIFDDLKRYSRDTEFHLKLKREMAARNAIRVCLNFPFDDSPEGKFSETIAVAAGTLEREQNGRQVTQKMMARMEQGFWVFPAPKGYHYVAAKGGGHVLEFDPILAPIVKEALEGYAAGHFESQGEVREFLNSQPAFPKPKSGVVTHQRVADILTQPIHAGYLNHQEWGINWVKARHDPLISLETFEKIQERRKGSANAPTRKNLNHDFPLRGFVLCNDCHKPLTACWSAGKLKKYPYYLCDTKACESYRKSIPRERIEGEFADIVRSLQPTQNLIKIAKAMFKDAWNQRRNQAKSVIATLKQDEKSIQRQIDTTLERIMDASNSTVIAAYERKVENLERKRQLVVEKLQEKPVSQDRFDEFIEHAMTFLANPWNLWDSGQYHLKRLVLRLAFSERIAYCRKEGYRTPKTTLPFKVLENFRLGKFEMVRSRRTLRYGKSLYFNNLNDFQKSIVTQSVARFVTRDGAVLSHLHKGIHSLNLMQYFGNSLLE